MTITVNNQRPALLESVHTISCTGDYDPLPAIEQVITGPLAAPLNPAVPANIVDDQGTDLVPELAQMLLDCLGDQADPAAEQRMKEVLGQTLLHYDARTPLPVGELFPVQAATRLKLPAPTASVVYTAGSDVIPAAKTLLAGRSPDDSELLVSLAYAYHPNTVGFWFQSSAVFSEFQAWLAQQVTTIASVLPPDTVTMLSAFGKLTLTDLTESLLLRRDDDDGNEEQSFARMIVFFLMTYVRMQQGVTAAAPGPAASPAGVVPAPGPGVTSAPVVGVLPFTLGELFCPRSLVLVNLEAHARASASKVTKEWELINTSLASPIRVISNKALSRLTTMVRTTAKLKALAASQQSQRRELARSASVRFRKQPPSRVQLINAVLLVLRRMGKVNKSQNIFRKSKTTFAKANRRDPDDFNKPGRVTSVQYMPDIHAFVDTSGSISEANYQQSVMMLITLAKKLNVNLYFNSFSHVLSQEVMLRTENKSAAEIWKEFRRIPKVNGGTDYRQIWEFISASPVRRRRLSIVITDFEWFAPAVRLDHPANLYYAPCGSMDWDQLVDAARHFADSMHHIDPAIKQRLLGMIV